MDAGLTLPRVRTREDSKETLKRCRIAWASGSVWQLSLPWVSGGFWGMLSRLFVCAGGSGAVAQPRERFGAAGRGGGEGFAQTAREKENKANFSFIPLKGKQNRSPLALHKLKRRLNPCLERTLAPTSYIFIFTTLSEETNEFEAWIYPWPCAPTSLQEEALGASFLQGQTFSSFSLSWLVAQVAARALFDF